MKSGVHFPNLKMKCFIGVILFCYGAYSQSPPVPKPIIDQYNEVMNFVKKAPPLGKLNPPPPPSTYLDYCFPCDKERQAQVARDSINFTDVYMGEETAMLKKANRVGEHFANRRVMKVAFDSSAFLKMTRDMFNAKMVLSQRIQAKLMAAWKKYYNVSEKVPFLVHQMMEQHRMNEIVGVKSESSMPSINLLRQLEISAIVRKFRKARDERDYTVLLNTDVIVETFRQAAMIGLSADDLGDNEMNYVSKTRFLFTIETKAKIQVEDGSYGASFSNQSVFSAKPGKDCHLTWTQVDPSGTDMVYELKDIFMIYADAERPVYVGPKSWLSPAPQIKLDFCDDTRDTAHFYGFNCPTGVENWTYKGQSLTGMASQLTYILCFPDKRPYTEMQGQREMNKPIKSKAPMTPFGFYVKQSPKNKVKIILEKSIDAKEFTTQAQYVNYGEFKLKIEHVED